MDRLQRSGVGLAGAFPAVAWAHGKLTDGFGHEVSAGRIRSHPFHFFPPRIMANTTTTPKHTDPATKKAEKENEVVIKDKTTGKAVKTQKK